MTFSKAEGGTGARLYVGPQRGGEQRSRLVVCVGFGGARDNPSEQEGADKDGS